MEFRQKLGGICALVAAGTFVFGFALFVTTLSDYASGDATPAEQAAFVADNQTALYVWQLVILIGFGLALIPLVVALHERLLGTDSTLARLATPLGLIWSGLVIAAGMIANLGLSTVADLHDRDPAEAATVWSALDVVTNGLGGGNEVVGGVWVLLVSVAALRARALPRACAVLGMVAGLGGIVTLVPAWEDVGALFGLGMIVWFIWVGAVLLRRPARRVTVPSPADASDDTMTGRSQRAGGVEKRPRAAGQAGRRT